MKRTAKRKPRLFLHLDGSSAFWPSHVHVLVGTPYRAPRPVWRCTCGAALRSRWKWMRHWLKYGCEGWRCER